VLGVVCAQHGRGEEGRLLVLPGHRLRAAPPGEAGGTSLWAGLRRVRDGNGTPSALHPGSPAASGLSLQLPELGKGSHQSEQLRQRAENGSSGAKGAGFSDSGPLQAVPPGAKILTP